MRYKCVLKGWSGKKYYMPMTLAETEARRKIGLVCGVVFGMPVMGIICMIAGGLL